MSGLACAHLDKFRGPEAYNRSNPQSATTGQTLNPPQGLQCLAFVGLKHATYGVQTLTSFPIPTWPNPLGFLYLLSY